MRFAVLVAAAAITAACGGSTAPQTSQTAQDEPDASGLQAVTCDHRARGGPFHVVYDATTAACPVRPAIDEPNGVAALGTACFGSGFDWSADGCTLTVAERCAGYTLTATTTAEPGLPSRRVTGTATFGDGCTYAVTATR